MMPLPVSALGLGTSPFGGVFGAVYFDSCKACLDAALDLGINFIDTSPYYGHTESEKMVGRCLKGVPRDRYFIGSKVGRYEEFDFSAARVTQSVDESLLRLGCEYLDVVQCHDIEFGDLNQIVEETIPALRRVVEQGKARFVGITGLPLKVLTSVLKRTEVDVIMSYCHCTLLDTSLLDLKLKTGIFNAAPYAMGLLTSRELQAWHPAPVSIREACLRARGFCDEVGVSIEHVAMRFAATQPGIDCTVVGVSNAEDIRQNVHFASTPVDPEITGKVLEILMPVHNQTWPSGRAENN